MKALLFILLIVVLTLIGDYLLKLASQKENSLATAEFGGGALIYGLSAVGWVYAMKHLPLASVGVIYSVLVILFLAIMGVTMFGEKLAGAGDSGPGAGLRFAGADEPVPLERKRISPDQIRG